MQIREPAEYAILGLLSEQPMHGYEMFQRFEHGTLGEIVHLEMSQMYAFLKKLERLEAIEAVIEKQGARPPRKIFHLTEQGRATFTAWLTQPVEKPRDIRILFLIKLYFLLRLHPERAEMLIEEQIQACERFLSYLQSRQNEGEPFFDHVVLRSRIYQTQALLEWLRELRAMRLQQ
ncbi:DNA-binding PadR family transcriptional regulator [Thermosporothrix hazakensis]|jgi:DNA-binding PadR family transcriptional regulator|uniref:DNA-binding PadR family transcriptional regulator n=1 Tax=Thermosporothrix hazakensis TaxID=644383 RepID=A0A326U383_THEHA|nr:PadR family transcriptional regulator [Thermosporothrix hazakensis]PZW25644.1 DNA-binding PadR family transcriptional regulator [Thermosporothrix hazakensis]GCE48139.1 PadR family transcriptional regulator [Thermosporothrix hazakensis]